MQIIAINRFYRPDHAATAQMLTDLAEHLARSGLCVRVLTSRLLYDGGGALPARETLNGVLVERLWSTSFGRAGLFGRAIDYLSFYISAFFALLTIAQRGDLVIAKTDPPLISIVAGLACRFKGARLVNWCQDLFPEVAGALGMRWTDGPIGAALRMLRNRALKLAVLNAALNAPMASRLAALGAPPATIRILPNWADAEIRPIAAPANPLRAAWGLDGQFVIGYSGNLGRAHLPERIAALVRNTKDIPGLAWLFIGGGAGLDAVKAAAAGAANVHFHPYQPRAKLSESLSAPDAHLISLEPACEGLIAPSKLYGVRAAGRPVVFLGAADGGVAREMAASLGRELFILDPDQPDQWRDVIAQAMRYAQPDPGAASATSAALEQWRLALCSASDLKVAADRSTAIANQQY
jgi:hypothetical protein